MYFCLSNKKQGSLPFLLYGGQCTSQPQRIQYLRRIIILVTIVALINVLLIGVLSFASSFSQEHVPSEVLVAKHELPCQGVRPAQFPKIIHQIWTTKKVPEKWRVLQQGCRDMNPGYEYMLWTHDEIDTFIKTNYPWILETYNSYPYPMERLDAARYFILYHYGGVYIDMDMECITPFDRILRNVTEASSDVDVVLAATAPVGVTSSFLISKKNHPFLKRMTEGLSDANKWYLSPYWTVIVSTGPLYVWRSHLTYPCKNQVHVLPYELHSKQYLDHKHASTWHSWDGPIMLFFDHHGKMLVLLALVITVLIMLLMLTKRCRSRQNCHGKSVRGHSKKYSDEAGECMKNNTLGPQSLL